MTEAIMETRQGRFLEATSTAQPVAISKDQGGQPGLRHPQEGHVLSSGAESLQIQATDYGLITCEDILINRQTPEHPIVSVPIPSTVCSHLNPNTWKRSSQPTALHSQRHPEGFSCGRGRGKVVTPAGWCGGSGSSQQGLALLMAYMTQFYS